MSEIPNAFEGRSIDGYELMEEIARGGMGVIFKTRQISHAIQNGVHLSSERCADHTARHPLGPGHGIMIEVKFHVVELVDIQHDTTGVDRRNQKFPAAGGDASLLEHLNLLDGGRDA